LKKLTLVIVTEKIDLITSPAACILRIIQIDVSAAVLIAFSQEIGENSGGAVCAPFPEFCNPADIPRADVFLLSLLTAMKY
jgi:hypothetical protein